MKEAYNEYVFSSISRICQSLISEAEVLCELIDGESFEAVGRHVASIEDEADNIKHEVQFYYQENRLYRDPEAMLLYEVLSAVEKCTDIMEEISKIFMRLNIACIKDNIISSFISAGSGAVKMAELINSLHRMNKVDSPIKDIIELDNYSVEYKKLYDINMNKLYDNGNDPIDVMRWTAVYEAFKELFEQYEAVAESCGQYCFLKE